MEGEQETAPKHSNGTSLNDLQWPIYNANFKVTIIQRQITRKWYKIELYLRRPTNRKSYMIMIYRTAKFSMTLNDPTPTFKVTPFSDAEYLRNGTRYRQFELIKTYTRLTMTWNVARSLCDSWACFQQVYRRRYESRRSSKPKLH